jgi:hypothetical protein
MTKELSFYSQGHLVLAAIRVLEHLRGTSPTLEEIRNLINMSLEKVNFICKKLHDTGVIEIVEGAFGNRMTIADHMKMENFLNAEKEDKLKSALEEFQKSRLHMSQKIADIQSEQAKKKKNLFEDLEKKIKEKLKNGHES